MIARCGSKEWHSKNGFRYNLLATIAECDPYDDASETFGKQSPGRTFDMVAVDDEGAPLGDSLVLAQEELGSKMRLSHAIS